MESEVFYLEKFLFHELRKGVGNLNLKVVGRDKAKFETPPPDVERFKGYLEMVEELLSKIGEGSMRKVVKHCQKNK